MGILGAARHWHDEIIKIWKGPNFVIPSLFRCRMAKDSLYKKMIEQPETKQTKRIENVVSTQDGSVIPVLVYRMVKTHRTTCKDVKKRAITDEATKIRV